MKLTSRMYVVKESSKYKTAQNSVQWEQSCITRTEKHTWPCKESFCANSATWLKMRLTSFLSFTANISHKCVGTRNLFIHHLRKAPNKQTYGRTTRFGIWCNIHMLFTTMKETGLTNINGTEEDRTHILIQFYRAQTMVIIFSRTFLS
jgi:hypothetical protein